MFFDNLKAECAKKGTSPTGLLKDLGMSTASVTSWKKGVSPSMRTVYRLADALDIDPMKLLDDSKEKKASPTEVERETEVTEKKDHENSKGTTQYVNEMYKNLSTLSPSFQEKAAEYIAMLKTLEEVQSGQQFFDLPKRA